jgi:hypothetical protein
MKTLPNKWEPPRETECIPQILIIILLIIGLSSCSYRGLIGIREIGEHQHVLESKIYKQGLLKDKIIWIKTDEFSYSMDSIIRVRDKEIKEMLLILKNK